MRAHQVGAVLAVVALTALAAPAQATTCKAGMKCVDSLWIMKCLAGNMKVQTTTEGTWVTLKNDDCFMLGKNEAVDLISTVQTGGKKCGKTRQVAIDGKIRTFKLPKGSTELKFKMYTIDSHFGTGTYAAAPGESNCLDRNSQRCNLCRYNLTIPIDGSIFCNRDVTCPTKGCLPGVCEDHKCGLGLPDDALCGSEGCNIGVCSDEGACSLVPGPDCAPEVDPATLDCGELYETYGILAGYSWGTGAIEGSNRPQPDVRASWEGQECNVGICEYWAEKFDVEPGTMGAALPTAELRRSWNWNRLSNNQYGSEGGCDNNLPEVPCGQGGEICCTENGNGHPVPGYCADNNLECAYDEEEDVEQCTYCGWDDGPACTGNPYVPTGCREEALTNVDGTCMRIPECGVKWQTCCETDDDFPTRCQDHGFGCINGTCTECGIEWRPACPSDELSEGFCLDEDLAVANDGNCQKCGRMGGPPCAGGECTANHTILIDNVCESCGETNRPCCAHEVCREHAGMCMQGMCMRGSD